MRYWKGKVGKMSEEMRKDQEEPVVNMIPEEPSANEPEAAGDVDEAPVKDEGAPTELDWEAALTLAVKQRDEYLDMARRSQAEFLNYKKRTQQSRVDGYDDGVRETVAALLPTLDNLERALSAAAQTDGDAAILEGIQMVQRQLVETLTKLGLEELPALGEEFNPDMHNAVMREQAEEGQSGKVLEVFQKGYRVKDRIIRYAMVKVGI